MDKEQFLSRIQYQGPIDLSLKTLGSLQRAFLLTVPFENLDIHTGKEISLASEAVYKKIVIQKRGGFCYECNGAFYDLLINIGFNADFLSAQMKSNDNGFGPEFDHMVLQVTLDGNKYLVDVGNGQSFRSPLRMDGSNEDLAEGNRYQVREYKDEFALYQSKDKYWKPRFLFNKKIRKREDFGDMCRYHQKSPKSIFTQKRLATIATKNGRITLSNMQLSICQGEKMEERELSTDKEYYKALKDYMGITF